MSINEHIEQYLNETRTWKMRAGEHTFRDYQIAEIEKLREYEVDDQYVSFERVATGSNEFIVYLNDEETGISLKEMQGNLGVYEARIGDIVRNNDCPITAVIQVMQIIGQI
jgi:hypothetical protein